MIEDFIIYYRKFLTESPEFIESINQKTEISGIYSFVKDNIMGFFAGRYGFSRHRCLAL